MARAKKPMAVKELIAEAESFGANRNQAEPTNSLRDAPQSIDAVRTIIDRMENGLHEVRDLAHAVFIITGTLPWDESEAAQRVAGLIMERAQELKAQRTAAMEALCNLVSGEREASNV